MSIIITLLVIVSTISFVNLIKLTFKPPEIIITKKWIVEFVLTTIIMSIGFGTSFVLWITNFINQL